jgi:hypothetical protein
MIVAALRNSGACGAQTSDCCVWSLIVEVIQQLEPSVTKWDKSLASRMDEQFSWCYRQVRLHTVSRRLPESDKWTVMGCAES